MSDVVLPGREAQVSTTTDPGSVRVLLERAAAEQARATVMSPSDMRIYPAKFVECERKSLWLELEVPEARKLPRSMATMCVSFVFEQRNRVFTAQVWQALFAGSESRLQLAMPRQVMGTECRTAFRVPIEDALALLLSTRGSKQIRRGTITNISLTGAFVCTADQPPLVIGDSVSMQLQIGGVDLQMDAVVVRETNEGYGVFFPTVFREGEVVPPRELQAVVRTLEAQWLRRRKSA